MFDSVLFINLKIEKQLKLLTSKELVTYIRACTCRNAILLSQEKNICHSRYIQEFFFYMIVNEKSRLENSMYHSSTFI